MNTVTLSLEAYEQLKKSERKCRTLENKLNGLIDKGKVAVVVKFERLMIPADEIVEVRGLDAIKEEVAEHFKQGLFDEQLKKSLGEKQQVMEDQNKKIMELQKENKELQKEISILKSRSLLKRIINK